MTAGKTKKDIFDAVIDYVSYLKTEDTASAEVSVERLAAFRQSIRESGGSESGAAPVSGGGLAGVAARVAECRRCSLCQTRTNTVPGQGSSSPEVMFVGEGPGADEDAQGLAFIGRAGQLLTKIIQAMGMTRDEVFIGNIVKCRPPGNRVPSPEEMEACIPYLHEQIDLLKPRVIVCLGATAVKGLFGPDLPGITKIRGQWRSYQGIDTLPTYHPAYLLRNPPAKRDVWIDMQEVLRKLGRPIPKPKGKE